MERDQAAELRRLKRAARFLAGDVGLVSSELYVLLHNGEEKAWEELCTGLREAVAILVCRVKRFSIDVEVVVGGVEPPSVEVEGYFEEALRSKEDAVADGGFSRVHYRGFGA